MEILLKETERIDDLQLKNLKIIQDTEGFCFGIDAVLLGNYAEVKRNAKVVDLGTGTGIIPLIIYGKNKPSKIYAVEVQPEVAEMAKRTMKLNKIENEIEIVESNLKEVTKILGKGQYDVVTTNPPYMPSGAGEQNPEDKKAISRHEVLCTLEDVIKTAAELLNTSGKFFMVHRPQRLVDILTLMRTYDIEPKSIRFIHPYSNKKPNLLLIKGIKGGMAELKMEDPLYVYNEDGTYTAEIHQIYGDMWEGK